MDNLKIEDNMLFIAADGDGVGKKVGRAVIANDIDQLHKISSCIDAAQDFILHWAKQHDGIKISGGGDEFTAAIPKEALDHIEALRTDIAHAFGYTISVGVGKNLSEAGTALLVAKLRGKDRVVHFSEEIKNDIKKAKRRVRENRATPDEYKLSEAYLEKAENMDTKSCPYCEQTDGIDPSHCKWCHDLAAKEGEEGCPFCAQTSTAVGNENDCPFCNEQHAPDSCPLCPPDQNTKIQSPDSNNAQAPAGSPQEKENYDQMGMNPPIAGKPEMGNNSSPVGLGAANPMDNTAGAPVEPPSADPAEVQGNDGIVPVEGAHSKDSLQAIATQIESETPEGKPDDKQAAASTDDTQIVGKDAEGNISRPGGFEENTPADMGIEEQNAEENKPDLSGVLRDGLESQSSDIDKENVRNMVGQALQGFKASKNILENAKVQAPGFYQASISMLAAMIKMAEMLGLSGGAGDEAQAAGIAMDQIVADQQQTQAQGNEWHEPFPTHPDNGGAEKKPGHAPSKEEGAGAPKDHKSVGQPIGKLPSKATQHVARTPMPPGAINAKGQQKVIDPKTGKTRFIDRKQGMVQSATGVPVKPPGRSNDEPKN